MLYAFFLERWEHFEFPQPSVSTALPFPLYTVYKSIILSYFKHAYSVRMSRLASIPTAPHKDVPSVKS